MESTASNQRGGVEDTSRRDPMLHLLGAMSDGSSGYITGMEAAGQRQLVASEQLPSKLGARQAEYEVLGFTFGDPVPGDPMFRTATLPAGWTKKRTDHSMWSQIVDQYGRKRVAVFYKAAFYDRDAFMYLETPASCLRSALYEGTEPVLDDVWLTAQVADEVLVAMRDSETTEADEWAQRNSARPDADYAKWEKGHRTAAAKAEALRARLAGGTR